jgi:sugar phosphate isomerase/epimerase
VRLAIEPLNRFETYFITRGAQAMALAEAVGDECGVCLDAFHINIEEKDLYQTIVDCGPRLADFHVADNNRMPAGWATTTGSGSSTRCAASATTAR